MKIKVDVLGWTNKCCGCSKNIKPDEKTYILYEMPIISGSIHLCSKCINDIKSQT